MRRLLTVALLLVASVASHAQVNGNATITAPAPVFGLPLTVTTSSAFAGAISSIRLGSKEFINNWDHGRQLQMNAQFFDRYECYNPYEAGSKYDTNKPVTSSQLQSLTASGNKLESTTQMAWYIRSREPRGPNFGDYCGDPALWLPCPPYDGNPVSSYKVHKTVTIGFAGIPNVIEFLSDLYVPEAVLKGNDEIVAVLPYDFSSVWSYDLVSKEYRGIRSLGGETDTVRVVATPDGSHAMGFYSPEVLQPYHSADDPATWWREVPPDPIFTDGAGHLDLNYACAHIGAFRRYDSFAGSGWVSDRGYFVIGNLDQVRDSLSALHSQFSPLDPEVFNWRDYIDINRLSLTTQTEAENHWLTQGMAGGLRGSKTFSASQYLELNPDLASTFGATHYQAAVEHYVAYGRAEGRSTVAAPAAGLQHTAVVVNGRATTTGQNVFGQLGNGETTPTSAQVVPIALDHGVTEVVAGDYTSFAVKNDGTLWMWGSNAYGGRGDGTIGGYVTSPVQVPLPAHVATPVRNRRHAVALGMAAYAAVDTQGQVWTWGVNWSGRLGDVASHLTPARVKKSLAPDDYLTGIISIAAAGGTMAALDADQTVWTWGAGEEGTLGNGATDDSPFAVQVVSQDSNSSSTPLLAVTQVACGSSGFCIALTLYGQVFGWGNNDLSQMGIAPGGGFSIAMPISVGPNDIDAIACGSSHCIARSSADGSIYGWGYNGRGQLGTGIANVAQFPPVRMKPGPDGMDSINELVAGGDSSVMVRYVDRTLFGAGDNQSGQLGVSASTGLDLPIRRP